LPNLGDQKPDLGRGFIHFEDRSSHDPIENHCSERRCGVGRGCRSRVRADQRQRLQHGTRRTDTEHHIAEPDDTEHIAERHHGTEHDDIAERHDIAEHDHVAQHHRQHRAEQRQHERHAVIAGHDDHAERQLHDGHRQRTRSARGSRIDAILA
jgi:hypothetical protein